MVGKKMKLVGWVRNQCCYGQKLDLLGKAFQLHSFPFLLESEKKEVESAY